MEQTINLNDLEIVKFNGLDVESLQLNGTTIWEKAKASDVFNYTGLDANGNMEGQLAFDGTIVAYAIGKPTITITTAEDGTQSESITYPLCNGYNNEYYNYDFNTSMTNADKKYVSADERIISENLVIPDKYNGKPITTILESAFYNNDWYVTDDTNYKTYQSCFLKTVTLGQNIVDIQGSAFAGIGCYHTDANTLVSVFETINIYESHIQAIGGSVFSYIGGGNYNYFNLPTSLTELGAVAFNGSKKVRVNSNLTMPTGTSSILNIWSTTTDVIFSSNVTIALIHILHNNQVLVFEQDVNTEVTLNVTSTKNAAAITIYTDNNSVKNFDWATNNYTVTFKSLSEYTGG